VFEEIGCHFPRPGVVGALLFKRDREVIERLRSIAAIFFELLARQAGLLSVLRSEAVWKWHTCC
jgi:hypothetical protein